MRGVISDLRHATKLYARTPLSSALAVGALAAALAFVSVFVSMWNDLALKPHPGFADSGRLVSILIDTSKDVIGVNHEVLVELDEQAVTLQGVVGIESQHRRLVTNGQSVPVRLEFVSGSYFPVLRPGMHFGRPLAESDHVSEAEPVAVLSYRFWRQQFQGRRDVLGEVVELSGSPMTTIHADGSQTQAGGESLNVRVVGVMARNMGGSFGGAPTDFWLALEPDIALQHQGAGPVPGRSLSVLARLGPDLGHAVVSDELNSRFSDLPAQVSRAEATSRWQVYPRVTNNPEAAEQALDQVRLFMAASVLVAVIAAVNIGLFMLARAPGRRREVNLRFALGASRRRIARQLITEAGVLVVSAGLLGLAASLWLSAALQDLAFLDGADWRTVNPLDWRVLALLSCGLAVLTATAALAPAFGLRQTGVAHALRQVSARAGGAQRASGIAQIALAGLLGGAALGFGWQLLHLSRADFGFEPDGIVVVAAEFNSSVAFGGSWEELVATRASRREIISTLPVVEALAFGVPAPTVPGFSMSLSANSPDDPAGSVSVSVVSMDADFPRLLGMRLLAGAMPQADDPLGVLINETMALQVWGHLDVIGEPVPLTAPMPGGVEGAPRVVGVLADVAYDHPQARTEPTVFSPATFFSRLESIVLQTQASPAEVRGLIQGLIDQGLIEFEIGEVLRLSDSWHQLLAADRARAQLSIIAALVAVFLAAFGFYGTQRYLVAAGRREFAIQAALGAGPKALNRMVLLRGLALGLPGLVLGTLLAFIGIIWLQDGFIDQAVSPWAVSLLVAAGIAALILLASLGPARQARRMAPADVLRED